MTRPESLYYISYQTVNSFSLEKYSLVFELGCFALTATVDLLGAGDEWLCAGDEWLRAGDKWLRTGKRVPLPIVCVSMSQNLLVSR